MFPCNNTAHTEPYLKSLSMKSLSYFLITLSFLICFNGHSQKTREWYELKVYKLKSVEQEKTTETFLRDAYLPALHRAGLKNIGVFKPIETDSTFGKRIYVLIVYPSLKQFSDTPTSLNTDTKFLEQGKEYLAAPHDKPPFNRIESALLQAFALAPILKMPKLTAQRNERIYELRSYEGPTEKKNENKIKMFNEGGEIDLFASLNFNAVFYGEVAAGSNMPNLMYMTAFENMTARDDHWKAFFASAQWEKLKADPQYQNNVSHADITLLRPTAYSDY